MRQGGQHKEGAELAVSFNEVQENGPMLMQGKKLQDVFMRKDKGAKETGGWRYWASGADGKAVDLDPVKACYACHEEGAKGSDYVFSRFVQ